jgi:hypothetical protein
MPVSYDYRGYCAVKFNAADATFSQIPLLPGSRIFEPKPTDPIFAAAQSSFEPMTQNQKLVLPSLFIRTHLHSCWFTVGNLQKLLGADDGSNNYPSRSLGHLADCDKVQFSDGTSTPKQWSRFKLATLQLTSFGLGAPILAEMVLMAYGAEEAASALTPAPEALDPLPYHGQGAVITGATDVQAWTLSFNNGLRPVTTHPNAPLTSAAKILAPDFTNTFLMYELSLDQLDSADTVLNPALTTVAAFSIALNNHDATAAKKVVFAGTVGTPDRDKSFSMNQGVTRRVYNNLKIGSTASLKVTAS